MTVLPRHLMRPLETRILEVKAQHRTDRKRGVGWAALPGKLGRWHLHQTAVQRAVKRAVRRSRIRKPATCHTFRHSFATQLLRDGHDVRT